MDTLLQVFGVCFALFSFSMILVPFFRGRSDLISTWNLFWLGSAVFVGGSSVNAATNHMDYVDYVPSDYWWFFAGAVTFYATVWAAYRWFKFPSRWAGRWPRKWPGESSSILFMMLPFCVILSLLRLYPPPVPVLGQFAVQFGSIASTFALTFIFVAWWKNRSNPILLWTLIGVAVYAVIYSLISGSSRRYLLSVLLVGPVCVYWLTLRYRRPGFILSVLGALGLAGALIIGGYTVIRHRDMGPGGRDFGSAIESLEMIPSKVTQFDWQALWGGQNAVEVSLTTIHLYRFEHEPEPFYSLYFVLVNPIPRSLWPGKPENLGVRLPNDPLVRRPPGHVNWGPGVVGHGFHEGGLHMLIFYGLLMGWALRYLDELLIRQSANPYLLGVLVSSGSQFVAWSRGDIGVFTLQILNAVALGLLLGLAGRVFFGTGQWYPRSDYPANHPYQPNLAWA